MLVSIYGQAAAGVNTAVNVSIGPIPTVASHFKMSYDATAATPTVFVISSITVANFATVSSGVAQVYVQFR
jgi:hypothetical protein